MIEESATRVGCVCGILGVAEKYVGSPVIQSALGASLCKLFYTTKARTLGAQNDALQATKTPCALHKRFTMNKENIKRV